MSEIAQALTRIFDRHRIVFWYDEKQEMQAEFEALILPGVEKIALANNQFAVKYRILRQEPERKFLLYHAGPPPADPDNWLLDVQLAHGSFSADHTALWLNELGLGLDFREIGEDHPEFFKSARRREALKALLKDDDAKQQIRRKMLAVCAGADPRIDEIVEALLADLADGRDDKLRLIGRSGLDGVLWQELKRAYGYSSESPGLRDFAIELFKSCYALGLNEPAQLRADALVFLRRWKDSVRHHGAFEILSAQVAGALAIEQDLQARDVRKLVDLDLFELIDRKILSDLVRAVADRTLATADCGEVIRRRRRSHWYATYRHLYEAIDCAAQFLQRLDTVDLTVTSLSQGIQQYSRVWYQLDQRYRAFVHHARQSGQPTLLAPLAETVENLYTNNYLLKVNNLWQPWVDAATRWEAPPIRSQAGFYEEYVRKPFLTQGNKVFVVISDALRYEVGEELLRRIRQEDRYDAELEPLLAMVPSYTQLGMAVLLPHEHLTIAGDGAVLADGISTQGTENRRKILDRALPGRATALQAEDLLRMNRDESRALFRDHEVVYVYQNRIDAVGDRRDSEERVFDAVVEALDELILILKKLTAANVTNMLVTADHGFLYQHQPLDDSDFTGGEPAGAQILHRDRRFVLGRGLLATAGFKKFTAAAVGLQGDLEMLLPKSIHRLRQRGSGSRYVHGGASLQEVVVPVLRINKKRQSDVTQVDVDILRGANSVITSGQLTVAFYQTEPVTAKVQPRTLRAGIYTQSGELISDRHELTFDLAAGNAREREVRVQFILTRKADDANGQEVILRLEEQVEDTSHYREYRSARYVLRRSFTSDFDF